jgi:tetratricopeptide (TPR) repeat protein
MKWARTATASLLLLAATVAAAQVDKIVIPAGTPEDQATQAINAETDAQKKVAMLQEFVEKFSANPQAVAYGNWQLAQQYMDLGDPAKAMQAGEKAVAIQPHNLELLVLLSSVAERLKATDKAVDFAVHGAEAYNGIAQQPKPEGMDPEDFALRVKQDQDAIRPSYEYLEAAGLNAMVAEQDAAKRMACIERYVAVFHSGRLQDNVMQLAVYTLGQLNDAARMASFADKALAANPNSIPMLAVLADAFADSAAPANAVRAETYARKALELSKTQKASDENRLALYVGMAHSALGYALLKQEKTAPAIVELKLATEQLKTNPDLYPPALYRLSFAYAKIGKLAEAKTTLTELAGRPGPYQQPARELLAKVDAGLAKAANTKK